MAVTVQQTWPYGVYHTAQQSAMINQKLLQMKADNKMTSAPTVDPTKGPSPVYSFVDQAAADEWTAFMSQFNPEKTDVATV